MTDTIDVGDVFEWVDTGEQFSVQDVYVDEDGNPVVRVLKSNQSKESFDAEEIQSKIKSGKIRKVSERKSGFTDGLI